MGRLASEGCGPKPYEIEKVDRKVSAQQHAISSERRTNGCHFNNLAILADSDMLVPNNIPDDIGRIQMANSSAP
jgi:hypothetical protein